MESFLNLFECQSCLQVNEMDLQLISKSCSTLGKLCAVNGRKAQNDIVSCEGLVEFCFKILQKIYECNCKDEEQEVLNRGIHFLGNLVVANDQIKCYFWIKYFDILRNWAFHYNRLIRNSTEMIIYNLMLSIEDVKKKLLSDIQLLEQLIVDGSVRNEFGSLLLEGIIDQNLATVYRKVCAIHRPTLLKITRNFIEEDYAHFSPKSVDFLKKLAISFMDVIFTNVMSEGYEQEFKAVLKTLCKMSYTDEYRQLLQKDSFFISRVLDCLCSIHKKGLEGNNIFTIYSEIEEIGSKNLPFQHLYQVKSMLIRISGNLCFRNKSIQNQVRRKKAIPIILDCCKFDAKNPYITEWAILAIANLCFNNLENQTLIKNLRLISLKNTRI